MYYNFDNLHSCVGGPIHAVTVSTCDLSQGFIGSAAGTLICKVEAVFLQVLTILFYVMITSLTLRRHGS